jgi:undecaprenyl-diphosphatase
MTPDHPPFRQRAAALFRGWAIDRQVAVVSAVVAVLLFAFVQVAEEMREGEMQAFDERILLAFRTAGDPADPVGPPWVEEMVRDFTALGSTGVLTIVTLAVAGWLVVVGKGRTAGFVLVAVIGGVIVSSLLKLGFARPRPDLVPHGMPVFTNSFPSGHAMMSAVVYLTLGDLLARAQRSVALKVYILSLALFLTVLVGLSRIYLGVHWPSDVLAGWAVGACWALMCWLVMSRLQTTGRMEPETGADGG